MAQLTNYGEVTENHIKIACIALRHLLIEMTTAMKAAIKNYENINIIKFIGKQFNKIHLTIFNLVNE